MSVRKAERCVKGYYIIQSVVDSRVVEGDEKQYLVKWMHYSSRYNTWEPIQHLSDALDIVQQYQKQKKREERSKLSFFFRKRPILSEEKAPSSLVTPNEIHQNLEELAIKEPNNAIQPRQKEVIELSDLHHHEVIKVPDSEPMAEIQLPNIQVSNENDLFFSQKQIDLEKIINQGQPASEEVQSLDRMSQGEGKEQVKQEKREEDKKVKKQKLRRVRKKTQKKKKCLFRYIDTSKILVHKGNPRFVTRKLLRGDRIKVKDEQVVEVKPLEEQLRNFDPSQYSQIIPNKILSGLNVKLRNQYNKMVSIDLNMMQKYNPKWVKDLFESYI